jgi:hypothetical protein
MYTDEHQLWAILTPKTYPIFSTMRAKLSTNKLVVGALAPKLKEQPTPIVGHANTQNLPDFLNHECYQNSQPRKD